MATTINLSLTPLFIFGLVVIIAVAVIIANQRKSTPPKSRYHSYGASKYVPRQFSEQMELDMRLPYRRFKQLYPYST
ncbi:MAG: hypothetical protein NWE98_10045 [Candidatus Bathyarchaeota archaeon]|nr:hypothetical protein [Candidatus Bathyarchaeota archaeon]